MTDRPDHTKSSSPSFGRRRVGQVLTNVEWNDYIAAGANQLYTDGVDRTGYNFNIDTIHISTDAKGPQRYELDLQISGVWVRYLTVQYELYAMLSLSHVAGPGIPNVTSWRDRIYNDNWLDRYYYIVRSVIVNEVC